MAGTPIWKGSIDIVEAPNSPRIVDDSEGLRATRWFEGPWDKVEAQKPQRGHVTVGLEGYFVWETIVQKAPGNRGLLEVRLATSAPNDTTISTGPDRTEIEIRWVELEKDIRLHKRYRIGGGGEREQTLESLEQIEQKLKDPASVTFADDSAVAELYGKIARGQTHYTEYYPVIRRRTIINNELNESDFDAGKLQDPPITFGPWVWRKTADDAPKVSGIRNWERFEEWTGADYWDTDLYEEA